MIGITMSGLDIADVVLRRASLAFRVVVLVTGQLVMLAVMHFLLEALEPEPNGFRFDDAEKTLSFAAYSLPPLLIGAFAWSRAGVGAISLLQAASPLLLLPVMLDPEADLNFAMLLWWVYLPPVTAVMLAVDWWLAKRWWRMRC